MKTVFIVGLGSLTQKIIYNLAITGNVKLVVMSRSTTNAAWLKVCELFDKVEIVFEQGDALNGNHIQTLLAQYQPDLIINSAALASPFCMLDSSIAHKAKGSGFALQLGSQLSVMTVLMPIVKEFCPQTPVINCSFPDLVNPVLSKIGLAPTAGIGNVSILELLANKKLQSAADKPQKDIRLVGHHAHVLPILYGNADQLSHHAMVFCDGQLIDGVFDDLGLSMSPEQINHTTAISAMPVIEALLWQTDKLSMAFPGALGFAGGVPMIVQDGQISTHLPDAITEQQAIEHLNVAARIDGVEAIGEDGTVYFTEQYKNIISPLSSQLAEPFKPMDAIERHQVFLQVFFS